VVVQEAVAVGDVRVAAEDVKAVAKGTKATTAAKTDATMLQGQSFNSYSGGGGNSNNGGGGNGYSGGGGNGDNGGGGGGNSNEGSRDSRGGANIPAIVLLLHPTSTRELLSAPDLPSPGRSSGAPQQSQPLCSPGSDGRTQANTASNSRGPNDYQHHNLFGNLSQGYESGGGF
jgi:hypothetical protein